jgi:hypothetical protein
MMVLQAVQAVVLLSLAQEVLEHQDKDLQAQVQQHLLVQAVVVQAVPVQLHQTIKVVTVAQVSHHRYLVHQ